ncbi:26S proteasome regulatory subunit 6B, partial [Serinus canaria]|uniref:26S proteasome regulatory subunit 6B n=1 Tax=Serinus canaria TaxID=9135 RepID=UPI0021CCB4D0
MEELGLLGEKPQDDVPTLAAPRPLPGLSFLVPEPEDLEDLYSRYKKLQQELEFLEVQEELSPALCPGVSQVYPRCFRCISGVSHLAQVYLRCVSPVSGVSQVCLSPAEAAAGAGVPGGAGGAQPCPGPRCIPGVSQVFQVYLRSCSRSWSSWRCRRSSALPCAQVYPRCISGVSGVSQKLQQELEFLEVQEEYIKDEQRNLKKEFLHAQEEVKRIQSIPLVIGQFLEAVDQNTAIVGSTTGSNYYVRILSTIDRELLKPRWRARLRWSAQALVDVWSLKTKSRIMVVASDQKPDVVYADIGGMDIQKQEVREAVELPLTHFELYKQIGIDPPRGVLMYGPPGCGKTMLAKAVAHHTTAAFIRVVGSEFVQKYLGEGPRMVRDVFRLAKENAPAIIFIDEIDAIATKRFDAQTGADREVQRILLELLNQMDGFDQNVNVKVIMATNRADTLDPALLRPGRLDRKIEFPLPDRRQKRLIFSTITGKMNLSEEVDLEDCIHTPGHTWAHLGA